MEKTTTMADRIETLVNFFANGNNSKFAQLTGTSEANVRNYRKGTAPKIDVINAIVSKFELSYEWLMTGRGEMFQADAAKRVQEQRNAYTADKDREIEVLKEQAARYLDDIQRYRDDILALKEEINKKEGRKSKRDSA